MHVILDTNILVNNYRLDTPRFQALFSYLKKTKSKLLIPELVMSELLKKYKEHLFEYSDRLNKDNRILFGDTEMSNVEQLNNKYQQQLLKLFSDKKITLLKAKNHASKKLFERALNAIPPFDSSGRGFRDTLIWLDIIDTIKDSPDYFCFITANTKDFGSSKLSENLQKDIGTNPEKLLYFNSIEAFLTVYGEQISFIDKDLLQKFFKDKCKFLLSEINVGNISHSSIEEIPREYEVISIEYFDIGNIDIDDFYIYGSDANNYKIQVELGVSLELDVSVYSTRKNDFDEPEIINGYTYCWIEISLLINKISREIEVDKNVPISVGYAI